MNFLSIPQLSGLLSPKGAIHLTLVATRCSIRVCVRRRDILLAVKTTREQCKNLMHGSLLKRHASVSCNGFVGLRGFAVRRVTARKVGQQPEGISGVQNVNAKRLLSLGQYLRARESLCESGFKLSGM